LHGVDALLAHQPHADLGEVADDAVHVATDVAHLCELGRLDFDERRAQEQRHAPRDLGFAHAGGADQDQVLGDNLVAQRRVDTQAAQAVADRHRHGALSLGLADDVLAQAGHDLPRRQLLKAAAGVFRPALLQRDLTAFH
jgi:hypothetical protein